MQCQILRRNCEHDEMAPGSDAVGNYHPFEECEMNDRLDVLEELLFAMRGLSMEESMFVLEQITAGSPAEAMLARVWKEDDRRSNTSDAVSPETDPVTIQTYAPSMGVVGIQAGTSRSSSPGAGLMTPRTSSLRPGDDTDSALDFPAGESPGWTGEEPSGLPPLRPRSESPSPSSSLVRSLPLTDVERQNSPPPGTFGPPSDHNASLPPVDVQVASPWFIEEPTFGPAPQGDASLWNLLFMLSNGSPSQGSDQN